MLVQEQYPDLKANAAFHALQVELEGTENRILRSREEYNAAVRDYNAELAKIGGQVVNKVTGKPFKPRVYFAAAGRGAGRAEGLVLSEPAGPHVLAAALLAVLLPRGRLARPPRRTVALPPPLDGHVVDTSGTLSRGEVLDLDGKLEGIRLRTGFAVVALVVGSLQGEPIEDVAYRAFNTWQIGEKGKDNGVLIVVAPVDRRVRIETGKGVGGALTDLQSNDIIRDDMSPLLRQGRLHDAIEVGADAVAKDLVAGTPGAGPRPGRPPIQPCRR